MWQGKGRKKNLIFGLDDNPARQMKRGPKETKRAREKSKRNLPVKGLHQGEKRTAKEKSAVPTST